MDQLLHLHGNSCHTNCEKRVLCMYRSSACVWVIVSSWSDRPSWHQNYTEYVCFVWVCSFFLFLEHLQRRQHGKETIIKIQVKKKKQFESQTVLSNLSDLWPPTSISQFTNVVENWATCKFVPQQLQIKISVIKYITGKQCVVKLQLLVDLSMISISMTGDCF